jgi:cytoskeletal protein RodZ
MNSDNEVNIGTYLKNKRIGKNIELQEISKGTRISVNILRKIEENDLSSLPGSTYVRGFVINYLKHIGEPTEEAIEILQNIRSTKLDKTEKIHISKLDDKKDPLLLNKLFNGVFNRKNFVLLCVIVLGYSIFKGIRSLYDYQKTNEAVTEIQTQQQPALVPKKEEENLLDDSQQSEQVVLESVTDTTIISAGVTASTQEDQEQAPEEKVESEEQERYPKVEFKKLSKPFFNVAQEITPDLPLEAQKSDSTFNLYIKASNGPSWIRFKRDDENVKSFTLKENKDISIQGSNLYLYFGNVNNVEVYINQKKVTSDSKSGFKTMIFPREDFSNHYFPLFIDDSEQVAHFYKDYLELSNDKLD